MIHDCQGVMFLTKASRPMTVGFFAFHSPSRRHPGYDCGMNIWPELLVWGVLLAVAGYQLFDLARDLDARDKKSRSQSPDSAP
jgi:hypothetical protein